MYTISSRTLRGAAAAVNGARHLRIGRNGQDAAAAWVEGELGVVVVCDGCGSGASSEVGARLGAQLVMASIQRHLCPPAGQRSNSLERSGGFDQFAGLTGTVPTRTRNGGFDQFAESDFRTRLWDDVRAEVITGLDALVRSMPGGEQFGGRERIVHDYFLFTTIAAVMIGDEIAVWAIGDGAYAIDGRVRELGPFENNQPPYLAYYLVGDPQPAHLEVARGNSVIVATDGVAEIGLDHFSGIDRFVDHPDALRRQLAIFARGNERVDWDARRVVRTPALLQDDGAVAMLVRGRGVS